MQEIPSGYDPAAYATERLTVRARDGAEVPVSVVYRRDFPRDGSGKVHLYGYGAYAIAIPPGFSTGRLSLLDRGFACAIAHIRGGDDLGYRWYLDGKLEKRWNTFRDFVDVARGLVDAGFAAPGRIAIEGGSAGGELMGVVANTDPELWGAVVAHVPFVDVLATMLDDSLPLTPGEWPEWGDPIDDPAAFALIRSYSPYDNVAAQDYPPMLVTAGLSRSARHLLGAGEVGGEAAGDRDRRPAAAAQDQHGRRARRQVRALGVAARGGRGAGVRADAARLTGCERIGNRASCAHAIPPRLSRRPSPPIWRG